MKLRPNGWPLPRPKAIHHMVEDFLTEWDSPISHIQPLRRFLEHCVQTDLRAFYAGKAASQQLVCNRDLASAPIIRFDNRNKKSERKKYK